MRNTIESRSFEDCLIFCYGVTGMNDLKMKRHCIASEGLKHERKHSKRWDRAASIDTAI